MNISSLAYNKSVCHCKYCGWEGMPWSQDTIYIVLDWTKKTRTPKTMCPKCHTLDTLEVEEYKNYEDHPLLIKNHKMHSYINKFGIEQWKRLEKLKQLNKINI